jgi:predicted Fe-Mo cluster-binding NifX family protein
VNVGIVIFNEAVSPRFGCATQLLLAKVEPGQITDRRVVALNDRLPDEYPRHLATLGVQTLVCGGIHRRFLNELQREGIQVIWGVIGPADDALEAVRNGTLRSDQFLCRHGGRRGGPAGGRRLDETADGGRGGSPPRRRRRGGERGGRNTGS